MSKLWPVGVPGIASLFGGIGFGKGGPAPAAEQEGEGQEEKKEEEAKVEEIKEVSFYLFLGGSFFDIIKRVVNGFCFLFTEDCV